MQLSKHHVVPSGGDGGGGDGGGAGVASTTVQPSCAASSSAALLSGRARLCLSLVALVCRRRPRRGGLGDAPFMRLRLLASSGAALPGAAPGRLTRSKAKSVKGGVQPSSLRRIGLILPLLMCLCRYVGPRRVHRYVCSNSQQNRRIAQSPTQQFWRLDRTYTLEPQPGGRLCVETCAWPVLHACSLTLILYAHSLSTVPAQPVRWL